MESNSNTSLPVVGVGKFVLLYFATAGLYTIWWFYALWLRAENMTGRHYFLKLVRSLFAVLFIYPLFQILDQHIRKQGKSAEWQPKRLAWVFIGGGVLNLLLNYFAKQFGLGGVAGLSIFVVIFLIQFYVVYQAQLFFNRVEGDPFGKSNQKLSTWNHVLIGIGLFSWVVLISNFFNPPAQQTPSVVETSQSVL